jgi:MFS family permease
MRGLIADLSDSSFKNGKSGMRNVIALGVVSFFTDFSTEMILGILPLFIVSNLGASRTLLGVVEGSAEMVSYAFRMFSGSLSDKMRKRKIFIIIGYGLSTASKPFLAFSTTWSDAFILRTIDRIGKGIRTAPRDALIADSIPETVSGKAFGVHRTIDQMGAIAGPVAAFFLLQIMDIRGVFIMSLIPGALAVIILIFFVKEIVPKSHALSAKFFSNIGNVFKNKPFCALLVISGIFSLGSFNFSFILLRSSDLGISESTIPIVYAVINLAHTVIGIPSGILADKIGKERVLIIGYSIFILSVLFMIILSENSNFAFLLAAIFGLYVGISETVQRAIVPKYIKSELRGTAFGLYNLILGVSFFISNVVFGFLWDYYNLNIAIVYSMTLTSSAIIAMCIFIKKYATSKELI